ncbi:hypothetical protein FRC08_014730 [Ceratobasidium sp. 394]|nr:hypothetical protein FRC08_014730 [Ceratobasidium sp. 394]KAG9078063.1 hypothetical protein FS749_009983 [Ceratobasidium sp. UAMH 11750]
MSRDTVSIFAVLDDLEAFENGEYESRSQVMLSGNADDCFASGTLRRQLGRFGTA